MFIKHVLALSFAALALAAPQIPGNPINQTLNNSNITYGGAGGDSGTSCLGTTLIGCSVDQINVVSINNNTITNNTVGPGALSNNTVNARSESGS